MFETCGVVDVALLTSPTRPGYPRASEVSGDPLAAAAAAACLPAPWWLHTDLDVLASTEFAAVDYPQPGG